MRMGGKRIPKEMLYGKLEGEATKRKTKKLMDKQNYKGYESKGEIG